MKLKFILFCRREFSINTHFQLSSFLSNEEMPLYTTSSCGGLKGPSGPKVILADGRKDGRTDNGFKGVRY